MKSKANIVAAMLGIALISTPSWAAVGDVLLAYEAASGQLLLDQGWEVEAECLRHYCPAGGTGLQCHFQGAQNGFANDCEFGKGCRRSSDPAEHYNSPTTAPPAGACTYTEWVAFDDGNDHIFPEDPPGRPITIPTHCPDPPGGCQVQNNWGNHNSPPFGAPFFINAPEGYFPLRLSNGSGTGLVGVLPAESSSNRDKGSTKTRKSYALPGGVSAVTLVAKLAAGGRDQGHEMIQLRGLGYRLSFGVNGEMDSEDLGKFGYGKEDADTRIFDGHTVQVALPEQGVWGPQEGEFFVLRVVLRSNGTYRAWLNEGVAEASGSIASFTGGGSEVQIQPDNRNRNSMWIDYIRVLEGEVEPGLVDICMSRQPVFDVAGGGSLFDEPDGKVDQQDFGVFQDCSTGPAPGPGVFDALSNACKCMDRNHDQAVDQQDFGVFQRCYTGSVGTADPTCDD